jgi:hypothetical protein
MTGREKAIRSMQAGGAKFRSLDLAHKLGALEKKSDLS